MVWLFAAKNGVYSLAEVSLWAITAAVIANLKPKV